jgi:hypothetical protein
MARLEPETITDQEWTRVFLTPSLGEARRVEALLTEAGVDYVVSVEPCGTSLFGSPRNGAAFYVAVHHAGFCRTRLVEAGMDLGVLLAEHAAPAD